jgi:DNA-directed RNA polymerase specialized sigma24 family protein
MDEEPLIAFYIKLSIFVEKYKQEKHIPGMRKVPDHTYSNDDLIEGITRGDHEVFRYVSDQTIPYLVKTIGKKGTKSQVEEIVQEACIVIFRKSGSSGLQLSCKFLTYFIAVCKNIWNYNNRIKGKEDIQNKDIDPDGFLDEEEIEMLWTESREFRLYRRHFNTLKVKQQNILASSLNGVAYRDLFRQFDYKSEEAFKNEVFRIRRKLFQKISEDPEFRFLKNRTYWSYDE